MPAADKGVAAVLAEAAAVIERNGWYQADFSDPYADCPAAAAPVSAAGAIRLAAGAADPADECEASAVAEMTLARYLISSGLAELPGERTLPADVIGAWNDAPLRTAGDVIATMRHAAGSASGDVPELTGLAG